MSPHFERAMRFAETSEAGGSWTLSEIHRLALELQETHDAAISSAARKAKEWGLEACGGTGEGGDGYMNLAKSIENLRVDK